MNIKGIILLRKLGLPGPRQEFIFSNVTELNFDSLYAGATHGATIIIFDKLEPINQNPLREKNIRRYCVSRDEYIRTVNELIEIMLKKGITTKDLQLLTHQTYLPEDISYSGRISVHKRPDGLGLMKIDISKGLRKGRETISPDIIYSCKIVGDRLIRSSEMFHEKKIEISDTIIPRLIRDVQKIYGNPNVDFEIYKDTGALFYHEMFLDLN